MIVPSLADMALHKEYLVCLDHEGMFQFSLVDILASIEQGHMWQKAAFAPDMKADKAKRLGELDVQHPKLVLPFFAGEHDVFCGGFERHQAVQNQSERFDVDGSDGLTKCGGDVLGGFLVATNPADTQMQ